MMMRLSGQRPLWQNLLLIFLIPIVCMALGVATTVLLKIDPTEYSILIVNLFLLAACLVLLGIFRLSREDLGLLVIRAQVKRHIILSLIVLTLYILYYLFVIRISALKPYSATIGWGLLANLVVVVAEELYFRGILYSFFKKRFSARGALVITSLLFGLFHARQGILGIIPKLFTGWLWGSVRYASGMIFLIIFPIHYAFNTIWLLFAGNWNNLPAWAIYALPIIEFVLGLVFVIIHDRHPEKV